MSESGCSVVSITADTGFRDSDFIPKSFFRKFMVVVLSVSK
jgi:hypothetical protein